MSRHWTPVATFQSPPGYARSNGLGRCPGLRVTHPTHQQNGGGTMTVLATKPCAHSLQLKLKLQSFGHLMRRVDSLEKTLMPEGLGAGGEGDDRG